MISDPTLFFTPENPLPSLKIQNWTKAQFFLGHPVTNEELVLDELQMYIRMVLKVMMKKVKMVLRMVIGMISENFESRLKLS